MIDVLLISNQLCKENISKDRFEKGWEEKSFSIPIEVAFMEYKTVKFI